jgi:hypothetical protein
VSHVQQISHVLQVSNLQQISHAQQIWGRGCYIYDASACDTRERKTGREHTASTGKVMNIMLPVATSGALRHPSQLHPGPYATLHIQKELLLCAGCQHLLVTSLLGGGTLLHVDTFAHNKSGIAYQSKNRRPETV